MLDRRHFLGAGAALSLAPFAPIAGAAMAQAPRAPVPTGLRAAGEADVLRRDLLNEPVILESIEVLAVERQFFVRAKDTSGREGVALANPRLMRTIHPIFNQRIAPLFAGRDARDLHRIQEDLEPHQLNYKWAGLPFWCAHAWAELAVLDLLGQVHGLSVATMLGGAVRRESGLYYASGDRESSAEEVVEELRGFMRDSGTRAVKFRLGARLHRTAQSDARDARLIPLARRELGDDAILYADANSSYDIDAAVYFGRMLQDQGYALYEEPVRFDDFAETARVAEALDIPLAGGEQESSLRRFEAMIRDRVVDIVQPDILYFGGLTRAIRVARMAAHAGIPALPHISGGGFGFLNVLHFAAVVPNTTEYQEYKGDERVPHEVIGTGKPLRPENGKLAIPQGPGLGVRFDPDMLGRATIVTA